MDLAEYVSDYLRIDGVKRGPGLAREIAVGFADATVDPSIGEEAFTAEVDKLVPQVEYYLG